MMKILGFFTGMSFHDCYTKCREAFLVNSDATLRAQLTEFRDHKLIRSKKVHPFLNLCFNVIQNCWPSCVETLASCVDNVRLDLNQQCWTMLD